MLISNETIQCLEIESYHSTIPSTYLSYLTTGLSYNNSLQELSVPIPLSHTNNSKLQHYSDVISQKYNLTELKVYFTLYQSYNICSNEEQKQIITSTMYYDQGLPLITEMLNLHKTIKLLELHEVKLLRINDGLSQPHWTVLIQDMLQTIFLHPSLEYIGIENNALFIKHTLDMQKNTLIDKRNKQLLFKPIPIVLLTYYKQLH